MPRFDHFAGLGRKPVWIAIALVVSCASGAQAQTKLRWKFQKGEKLHYQVEQSTVTKTHTDNLDTRASQTLIINMSLVVKSIEPNGSAEVGQTFDRMRIKIDGPQGKLDYDSSAKPAPKESKDDKAPLDPQEEYIQQFIEPSVKKLLGAEFLLTFDELGEISNPKIPESVAKSLTESNGPGNNVDMLQLAKQQLMQTLVKLPKEAIKPGFAWNDETETPLGPSGKTVHKRTFTYKGPTDGGAKGDLITLDVTNKFTPSKDATFQLTPKTSTVKGEIRFDNGNGRILDSNVVQEDIFDVKDRARSDFATSYDIRVTTRFTLKPPEIR